MTCNQEGMGLYREQEAVGLSRRRCFGSKALGKVRAGRLPGDAFYTLLRYTPYSTETKSHGRCPHTQETGPAGVMVTSCPTLRDFPTSFFSYRSRTPQALARAEARLRAVCRTQPGSRLQAVTGTLTVNTFS